MTIKKIQAFDTETHLIRPGLLTPPMVCLTHADSNGEFGIFDRPDGVAWFREHIEDDTILWVGHNVAYDMGVMMNEAPDTVPAVFRAYAESRVSDTMLRESVLLNAFGKYANKPPNLAQLVKKYLNRDRSAEKSGPDVWRLRYNELDGVPLSIWPKAARSYAIDDALDTLEVFRMQTKAYGRGVQASGSWTPLIVDLPVDGYSGVINEPDQCRAGLALQLMSIWGMRVDQKRAEDLRAEYADEVTRLTALLVSKGLKNPDGSTITKAVKRQIIDTLTATATPEHRAKVAAITAAAEADWYAAENLAVKLGNRKKVRNWTATRAHKAEVAAWKLAGFKLPTTEGGEVKKGADVLEEIAECWPETVAKLTEGADGATRMRVYDGLAGDDIDEERRRWAKEGYELPSTDVPFLVAHAAAEKRLSTYLEPMVEAGEYALTPGYGVFKRSGRTSSFKPNIQNFPRSGGERECFVPREGHLFVAADYSTLELRAWAQVCLDLGIASEMATALRAGRDLHLDLGAQMMEITYEEAERQYAGDAGSVAEQRCAVFRGAAKPANFGLPVGMGTAKFESSARKSYGVNFAELGVAAEDVRSAWYERWSEARAYFNHVSSILRVVDIKTEIDPDTGEEIEKEVRKCAIRHPRSGRVRGGCFFTDAANSYFQGMAADGAKEALFRVAYECYVDTASPLFGSRPVAFIHDEIMLESPGPKAQGAARRLSQVMVEAMEMYIPDIPIICEADIFDRWCKYAKSKTLENGDLSVYYYDAEKIAREIEELVKEHDAAVEARYRDMGETVGELLRRIETLRSLEADARRAGEHRAGLAV